MSDIVKSFHINARRDEDARILAKLNAAAPYMYKDVHKTGRIFLEKALDDFLGEHGISWTSYLSMAGR